MGSELPDRPDLGRHDAILVKWLLLASLIGLPIGLLLFPLLQHLACGISIALIVGIGFGVGRRKLREKDALEAASLEHHGEVGVRGKPPFPWVERLELARPFRYQLKPVQVGIRSFIRGTEDRKAEFVFVGEKSTNKSRQVWTCCAVRLGHAAAIPRFIVGRPRGRRGKRSLAKGRLAKHVQLSTLNDLAVEDAVCLLPDDIIEMFCAAPRLRAFSMKAQDPAEQWVCSDGWLIYCAVGEMTPIDRLAATEFLHGVARRLEASVYEKR